MDFPGHVLHFFCCQRPVFCEVFDPETGKKLGNLLALPGAPLAATKSRFGFATFINLMLSRFVLPSFRAFLGNTYLGCVLKSFEESVKVLAALDVFRLCCPAGSFYREVFFLDFRFGSNRTVIPVTAAVSGSGSEEALCERSA